MFMAKKKKQREDFSTLGELSHNPFGSLGDKFGVAPGAVELSKKKEQKEKEAQPMLLVRMEKRRSGKMVTCIYHLQGDRKALLKKLKRSLATGGTISEDVVEIQGDFRERTTTFLKAEGFKVRQGN